MLVPVRMSPTNKVLVGGGLLLVLVVSLFGGIGSKQGVTNVVFAWVLHRHYFVRRLRLREALPVVVVGLGIVAYMNYARAGGIMLAGLTADTANPLSDENWGTFIQAGVASTLTPFEAFLVVLNTFPDQLPFQGGHRFFEDMVYPLFPRILFPEKPTVYGAGFFWEYHRGFLSLDSKIYEAISLPGHLYVDFGFIGIIAVGLAMGAIQRAIYRVLVRDRTPGAICLYGMIVVMTISAARAFTWTTYTIITNMALPTMAVWALYGSVRRVRLPPGGSGESGPRRRPSQSRRRRGQASTGCRAGRDSVVATSTPAATVLKEL